MQVARAFPSLRSRSHSTYHARSLKIAVQGCCHGELNTIYNQIARLEAQNGYKVDLLLICGDFEAMRNRRDVETMAAPQRYRRLGEFYKFYTGEATAPLPTIVIGGNHEASSYMWELYHGGWLAPRIYFLGHAGCVQVDGIRIAGLSGIFKRRSFYQGHHERAPYNKSTVRSIYHLREYSLRRMALLSTPDIILSHDWPSEIVHHGDLAGLLDDRPQFEEDIAKGRFGAPPLMDLLLNLKPPRWFAAHMHVRFEANVIHEAGESAKDASNTMPWAAIPPSTYEDSPRPRERSARLYRKAEGRYDFGVEEDPGMPTPTTQPSTRFVGLDKCVFGTDFLEVIDVPVPSGHAATVAPVVAFDPEWLAITRAFHPFLSTTERQPPFPTLKQARGMVEKELTWVRQNVGRRLGVKPAGAWRVDACQTFAMTAPGHGQEEHLERTCPRAHTNPQTQAFATLLDIANKINPA
ncbi:DBR1-domain-containing protein [Auriscalpium vulgare]|uniref:DBR1-domain-containing protein n=1 Tax=Auriscalpium vulgare TaxID=40419 RepID=A0ACB8R7G5_9AGAM|nr:DBR1-domain-containing protein [Auriscalpium vulgare]